MKLEKAFQALYDILALDKSLRNEILKELVKDTDICFLLSISMYFNRKNISITRLGKTVNLEYQVGMALTNVDYWESLGIREQVVLKELLSNSNSYDSTIFYAYGAKVYTEVEISEYFNANEGTTDKIAYLLVDSPKYYRKSMGKRLRFSNVPNGISTQFPLPFQTILVDSKGNTLAHGNLSFDNYLSGRGRLPLLNGDFKYSTNLPSIQYAINKRKDTKYALVFHKDGLIILSKAYIKETYAIIDFQVNDDFEVEGVWFRVGDFNHMIKCDIPQTILIKGVDKYTITVKCNELLNGDINNIEFIKFNLKDKDDS